MSNYKDFSKTVDDNMNKILDDLTEIQTNVLSKGSLEDKINFLIALEMDRLRSDVIHSSYQRKEVSSGMNLEIGKFYKRKMELAKGLYLVTHLWIQEKTESGYLAVSVPDNAPVLIEANCEDIFEEEE